MRISDWSSYVCSSDLMNLTILWTNLTRTDLYRWIASFSISARFPCSSKCDSSIFRRIEISSLIFVFSGRTTDGGRTEKISGRGKSDVDFGGIYDGLIDRKSVV